MTEQSHEQKEILQLSTGVLVASNNNYNNHTKAKQWQIAFYQLKRLLIF